MLKHDHFILGFLILLLSNMQLHAETSDSVLLGSGSAQACFYKLSDGQKTYTPFNDWHICVSVRPSAFPSNPLPGTTIRMNEAFGTSVYIVPNQSPAGFSSPLDTAGFSQWSKLHDSESSLNLGGLNGTRNLSNPFDFGWGIYNSSTKNVVGDSLYLITGPNGLCKKVWVEQLIWDTLWIIKTCNVDGSAPYTFQISKKQFQNRNFVYLDLAQAVVMDKEPNKTDWDLLFLKYMAPATQGGTTLLYGVTGVWSNEPTTVNEISGALHGIAQPDGNYSQNLSEIGYDWKTYNGATMSYDIPDDLTYFIKDRNNQVFKLYFTGYSGNSSGRIYFNFSPESVSSLQETAISSLRFFPVPATDFMTIEGLKDSAPFYDLSGRYAGILQNGLNNLSHLEKGMYIVSHPAGQGFRFILR